MAKLLDCTLRDGGYYTSWDFDSATVDMYINAMNRLPIDYVELGYRNKPSKKYMGKFGYSPVSVLKDIRSRCAKKLCVMLNEKDITSDDLEQLVKPICGIVDMIRLAVDPANFERAANTARYIKQMGFEVGFNCMYMSRWKTEYPDFLKKLSVLDQIADLFCMVDSFGGVTPEDVRDIYGEVRKNTVCPIGFHGHNNLQMGLINTITAIQVGCEYVDATVLGMGRGAGNLNMELLLTYLNSHDGLQVDFNVLGDVIMAFTPLLNHHHWGTNLPYMLAGANGIPQKEVMDWVTNRVYSFNSIIQALESRMSKDCDKQQYPTLKPGKKFDKVIVIGGGNSAIEHQNAIKEFLKKEEGTALVFATARNAAYYLDTDVPSYYVLVGTEGRRLTANVGPGKFKGLCVIPPSPRIMGTEIPSYIRNDTVELASVWFTEQFKDSVTALALQTAMELTDGDIYVVGYDGYPGNVLSEKEMSLTEENRIIFQAFRQAKGEQLKSLTPSLYKSLNVISVYQLV